MILIYLKLIAASVLGMLLQLFFKSYSLADTAIKANVDYSIWVFVKKDRMAIIGTFLTISLFFLLFGDVINSIATHSSSDLQPYLWGYIYLSGQNIANTLITIICVTIAYTGQDVALRFLGRTSKELKAALESHVPGQPSI